MNEIFHKLITEEALKTLPGWEREILKAEEENLVQEYCTYPDKAVWEKERYRPYIFLYGRKQKENPDNYQGRMFHYFPYESVALNRKRFISGCQFYFKKIKENLKRKEIREAGKFLGAFSHVLQDQGSPVHCLEGPYACEVMRFLDFLFPPSSLKPITAMQVLMDLSEGVVEMKDYYPSLLGTSIEEACFHLYEEYFRLLKVGRANIIPILMNSYENEKEKVKKHFSLMLKECVKVTSNLFHTALSLAFNRFFPEEVGKLKRVYLTELTPVEKPLVTSTPYYFNAVAKNFSIKKEVNKEKEFYPLKLKLSDTEIKEIEKGFGTGIYPSYRIVFQIPKKVFEVFQLVAGLHPELSSEKAKVRLMVEFKNKVKFDSGVIGKDDLASRIQIFVKEGGRLELIAIDESGISFNKHDNLTHIVWGEPLLLKRRNK